jgi:hypothetical protein
VRRDRAAGVQQQHGEHRALLGGPEINLLGAAQGADVTEDLEPQRGVRRCAGHRDTPLEQPG